MVWNLVVYCLDCCKSVSVRAGIRGASGRTQSAPTSPRPSTDSPSVGGEPRGARVVFTNTSEERYALVIELLRRVEPLVGFPPIKSLATSPLQNRLGKPYIFQILGGCVYPPRQ